MINGIMRVSPNSRPELVARAIAARLREGCLPTLQAMGEPATARATKALAALPRIYGRRVLVEISFVEVEDAPGERHQAIRLQIVG